MNWCSPLISPDISRLDIFSCQGPFSVSIVYFFLKLTRLSLKKLKELSFSSLLNAVILGD